MPLTQQVNEQEVKINWPGTVFGMLRDTLYASKSIGEKTTTKEHLNFNLELHQDQLGSEL